MRVSIYAITAEATWLTLLELGGGDFRNLVKSSQSPSNSPSPHLSTREFVERELRVVVQAEVAAEGPNLVHE
jgi:hypothetical protein